MAHKIELPHDIVLSTEGTEWHGLAHVVNAISDIEVAPQLFDIIESPCFIEVDGIRQNLEGYKTLVADHRQCRPDLSGSDQLIPLHIPKDGYRVISNREVWETMQRSLKDLGCKVTSVCTLERGKKFAISADIGGSDLVIAKDQFKANLNFVTSHDGTMAMETFDSMIRIVCMNTFQASRNAASDKFKVYHTKNAAFALSGLSDLLNAILAGRVKTAEVLEYLATHACDANDALAMAAGYFAIETDSIKLSGRAMNAASEIAVLFSRGIGNSGQSLYDLANGATEYWTSGAGVGAPKTAKQEAKLTPAELRNIQAARTYRSQLGQAADHKVRFIEMLADDSARKTALEMGREAILASAKAN
jgi:hypothetical protein